MGIPGWRASWCLVGGETKLSQLSVEGEDGEPQAEDVSSSMSMIFEQPLRSPNIVNSVGVCLRMRSKLRCNFAEVAHKFVCTYFLDPETSSLWSFFLVSFESRDLAAFRPLLPNKRFK